MSDTVKLIVELPTDKYLSVKTNMINDFIYDAVKHGIPLDDVKVEIAHATTLHVGTVGYVEAEKVIDILNNAGKENGNDK